MAWYEGAGQKRLEHDRAIVAEVQPDLRYSTELDGTLQLKGEVAFALPSGIPQRIATRIDFPADYPRREPRAYQEPKRFPRDADHHTYPDGQACLWLDVETRWRPNDAGGLRMFLDQLVVFYYRQLMMEADTSLPFPGPSRGHGPAGYLEHLEERFHLPRSSLAKMLPALNGGVHRNALCPCGRRVRYRKCHLDAVRRFRTRVLPEHWPDVISAIDKARSGKS